MSPNAFSYSDFILQNSKNKYTLFFALNIIERTVKSHWTVLDQNFKLSVRNFLIDYVIKLVNEEGKENENSFLISKINIVIVAIGKQEWTTTWQTFLSDLCQSARASQNICRNNMKMLILFSEEINSFWKDSLTVKKAQELRNKMSQEFKQVFELCQFIFDISQNNQNNTQEQVKNELLNKTFELFGEYTIWFPYNFVLDQKI